MDHLLSIFLIPTLSAFCILNWVEIHSITHKPLSSTRLLLHCTIFGILLLFCAYLLLVVGRFIGVSEFPHAFGIARGGWRFVTQPLRVVLHEDNMSVDTASLCTIPIAALYIGVNNFPFVRNSGQIRKIIMKKRAMIGGEMELLLSCAMDNFLPVMLTMENRKVYIGYILDLPLLREVKDGKTFIKILPLKSGFREKTTLKISKDMTDYSLLLSALLALSSAPPPARTLKFFHEGKQIEVDRLTIEHAASRGHLIDMQQIIVATLYEDSLFEIFLSTAPSAGTSP